MFTLPTRRLCLLVLAGAITSAAGPLLAQHKVTNRNPHFNLRLPLGFVPDKELSSAAPNILHGSYLVDPAGEEANIVLLIERLQGVIGSERLSPNDLPPGSNVRLFVTQWHELEVDGIEVPEEAEGERFVTFNVQIPLERNAIQVKLFGPVERRQELEQLLPEILDGLYGKSNWSNTQLQSSPFARSPHYRNIILGIGIAVFVAGLVLFYFLSRTAGKGSVLAAGVVAWVIGASMVDLPTREGLMVSGALKLTGTIGVLLGIVDLVRKRSANKDVLVEPATEESDLDGERPTPLP